ncbi:MAG: NUDIX domain-containing protein [Candidatus Doudnabacteria bacterium]|nr:NUDIX domain-containing protein [Candidatus Doudnabacteria bacterium]
MNEGKNIPVVGAIIERENNGQAEVLIQTRWKPEWDPVYSGTIEMPVGWIEEYENLFDALKREVFEETGLTITKIKPNVQTKKFSLKEGDESFAFAPYFCFQQTKGGKPWIGFIFLCEVAEGEPVAQESEVKDIRWIKKEELKQLFNTSPEKFFTLEAGVFEYYLNRENYE